MNTKDKFLDRKESRQFSKSAPNDKEKPLKRRKKKSPSQPENEDNLGERKHSSEKRHRKAKKKKVAVTKETDMIS